MTFSRWSPESLSRSWTSRSLIEHEIVVGSLALGGSAATDALPSGLTIVGRSKSSTNNRGNKIPQPCLAERVESGLRLFFIQVPIGIAN